MCNNVKSLLGLYRFFLISIFPLSRSGNMFNIFLFLYVTKEKNEKVKCQTVLGSFFHFLYTHSLFYCFSVRSGILNFLFSLQIMLKKCNHKKSKSVTSVQDKKLINLQQKLNFPFYFYVFKKLQIYYFEILKFLFSATKKFFCVKQIIK